jgi:hypothetical protein
VWANAQAACVFSSDPVTKTVKLTGNCGAVAGVQTQEGYTVEDNSQTEPAAAAPSQPPTLENMASAPPTVTYEDGELTIVARNSTLRDILQAVRSKTGAEIDVPADADERVVSQIGPGSARDVLASLLNGSHFNYVILGTEEDPGSFAHLILTPKAASDTKSATAAPNPGMPRMPMAQSTPVTPTGNQVRRSIYQVMMESRGQRVQQQQQQAPPAAPVVESQESAVPTAENESTSEEPTAKGAEPDISGQQPAASGPAETANPEAAAEPASTSGGQPQTPADMTSRQQMLQDLYSQRRQMMEQQHKPAQPNAQPQNDPQQ